MNYSQSLRYLDSFQNLERMVLSKHNFVRNLDRMQALLKAFSHPEKNFFPILIAGTKGKGSTGFLLESILQAGGVKTGFYSSPHLETPRERIRINGKMVSKQVWAEGLSAIAKKAGGVSPMPVRLLFGGGLTPLGLGQPTYFEIMTLLAAFLFKRAGVRVGIFEVGLGGRLDATRVLKPKVSILTPIHLDHEAVLGATLSQIATEKAAIIEPRSDVIVSPQKPEVLKVIRSRIRLQKARIWPVLEPWKHEVGMVGKFQRVNANVAARAIECLNRGHGFSISKASVRSGIRQKGWPGRMEILKGSSGRFLVDGAHNPASIEALVSSFRSSGLKIGKKVCVVFATSRDKKSELMLKTLGQFFSDIVVTRLPNARTQEVGTLLVQARSYFKRIFPMASVRDALTQARDIVGRDGVVVITGSFYLIGEARKLILSN